METKGTRKPNAPDTKRQEPRKASFCQGILVYWLKVFFAEKGLTSDKPKDEACKDSSKAVANCSPSPDEANLAVWDPDLSSKGVHI